MTTIHTLGNIAVRPFKRSDTAAIIHLFRDAVHALNIRHYSNEQVDAWAPEIIDEDKWQQSLKANICYVATVGSLIVGFADMSHDGYLDRLFVHKNYQARGVAYRLIKKIEQTAINIGLKKITAHASITAKIPAERVGFVVVKEQKVMHNGVEFTNYIMEKIVSKT